VRRCHGATFFLSREDVALDQDAPDYRASLKTKSPWSLCGIEISAGAFAWNELCPLSNRANVVVSRGDDHQRRETVRSFIHQQIPINLNAWHTEMYAALDGAAPPANPDSRFFWYVALIGNLVWAAPCMINPVAAAEIAVTEALVGEAAERYMTQREIAKQLASEIRAKLYAKAREESSKAVRSFLIKTMNIGGAAVGSDSVEVAFTDTQHERRGPEDGKKMVRNALDVRRVALEHEYKHNMRDVWADLLVETWKGLGQVEEPLDLFDLFLWSQMFPRIPFNDDRDERLLLIRIGATLAIESALADYNQQWLKWVRDSSMPHGHIANALWVMGTMAIPSFRPKLLFQID
jgi:hypothetical protein